MNAFMRDEATFLPAIGSNKNSVAHSHSGCVGTNQLRPLRSPAEQTIRREGNLVDLEQANQLGMVHTHQAGISKMWLIKCHAGTKNSLLLLRYPLDRQRQTNRHRSQQGFEREIIVWSRQPKGRS